MKKLLALVLALVMTLSLATVGANAAFEDESISDDYAEAVAVLNGMGVFQGDDNGKFNPTKSITRAEVATILYRIATADTAKHGSNKAGLYASYNKFSDGNHWAAGYIGYCANAELVKGYPDGTYKPEGNVTGYEVLAMILRAVGYDKNGEFSGADWALNVAKIAEQLGMLDNVAKTTDLGAAATRELVAELLFQGIQAKIVTYSPAFGYVTDKALKLNQSTLGAKFYLESDESADIWGRPTTVWFKDTAGDKTYNGNETVYAELVATPDAAYQVAATECDICADLGVKKSASISSIYTNGVEGGKDTLTATATKATLGEQGQQIEFYALADGTYRMVIIDTYLAKVVDVVSEKTDAKGHIIRDDYMQLAVYMNSEDPDTIYVPGNDFEEGDYVLVNVNEVEKVSIIGLTVKQEYVDILGEAESFEGTQTKNWYNSSKHTIDDKDYDDAYRFYLDDAKTTGTVKFVWFLDQFGNLIGDIAIDNSNYAVLKDLIWVVGRPGYAEATLVYMDGTEATATVSYIDGADATGWMRNANDLEPVLEDTSAKVGFVAKALDQNTKGAANVSSDSKYNGAYEGVALYRVDTLKDGTVALENDGIEFASDVTVDAKSSSIYDGSEKLNVNDNTQFLVRELNEDGEYVYVAYDRNSLPQYAANSADIFYTVSEKTGFVNRVYVKNANDEADFGEHLFVLTDSYHKVSGQLETYKMDVLVDGVERTICTTKANMELFAANVNKLFHVTWEKNSDAGYYGFVEHAALVNEAVDNDTKAEGNCDYVTAGMIDGNTIVSNVINWTVNADTKFIGVDSIDEIDLTEDGVWVIAADARTATAATVYVGTKLSSNIAVEVYADDNMVSYDMTAKKYVYNMPINTTDVDLQLKAVAPNTVFAYNGKTFENETRVYPNTIAGSYTWTVYAEDGVTTGDWTVEVKGTQAGEVSLKTFFGTQVEAYQGTLTPAAGHVYKTVKLNVKKLTAAQASDVVLENATLVSVEYWDDGAKEYVAIDGEIDINTAQDITWFKVNYENQAGVAGSFEVNAYAENA